MQVSEEQRRALYERLREHLDEATATLLLEVTVPANIELATRTDIHELRADLLLRITEVDGHLTLQIADLALQISEVARRLGEADSRLGARIGDVQARLGARIDELSARISDVEARLGARIDEVNIRIDDLGASLGARIDAVNIRIDELGAGLGARIDQLDGRVADLEKAVAGIGPMLMWKVVPILLTGTALLLAVATWLASAFG